MENLSKYSNYAAQMINYDKINSRLENIIKVQMFPNLDGFKEPNSFGVYKESGGNCLGVVGDVFIPLQPKILLDSLLDCDVDFEKMTYHEMKGGAKVRFQIPITQIDFKNACNVGDVTNVSLCIQTGFDGLTKTSFYLYTERLICTNGAKNSKTEFTASFKNTKCNQGKVVGLAHDVNKAVGQVGQLKELYLALNRVQITQETIDNYLLKVADLDVKKRSEWSGRKRNIFDQINNSIHLELNRTGNTLFGLYNGVTHYTNHVASKQNQDFIFVDNGAKLNDKALNFVTALI